MVARDGIEPPTPAFSGLRSANELASREAHIPHIWAPKAAQMTLVRLIGRGANGSNRANRCDISKILSLGSTEHRIFSFSSSVEPRGSPGCVAALSPNSLQK